MSSELIVLEEEQDNGHAETAQGNPNAQPFANPCALPECATDSEFSDAQRKSRYITNPSFLLSISFGKRALT